jgi:hypothetical protein
MAEDHISPLTYADLDMSRVDAHLRARRELLIVLSPEHANVLASLIENTRQLQRATSFLTRVGPGMRALRSTFSALLFHGKLMELSRAIVDFSGKTNWQSLDDGQVLFRITP